jgi:hypothetical protein
VHLRFFIASTILVRLEQVINKWACRMI